MTRDGREVRIICTDADCKDGSIVALVARTDGKKDVHCYCNDGQFYKDWRCKNDLSFAPTKHEGWVNVFNIPMPNGVIVDGSVYGSYEEAKSFVKNNPDAKYYVATVKIKWEE